MLESSFLGLVQGIVEWLPISSEGVITVLGSWLFSLDVHQAMAFALWLHLGTAIAACVYLRVEVVEVLTEAIRVPRTPSPLLRFTFLSVLSSLTIGLPLLLTLSELSTLGGSVAMVGIGALMVMTGSFQFRRRAAVERGRAELTVVDALITGVAQGLAVLPGLSRSGLTVGFLLARNVERREALTLSFLIGIPASVGAAVFVGLDSGLAITWEGAVGALVAAATGLLTIKALMLVASRVHFGLFVILVGSAIILGSAWQLIFA